MGISHEFLCWAWPLAARAAFALRDSAAARDLLAQLDAYQPGHLAPMLRAERDLVRARLAAADDDAEGAAAVAFATAIASLRERGTPYHLAHGLLDHAQYLLGHGDADAAAVAIDEARDIGQRLRCEPLLDRVANLDPATPAASVSPRTPA
jgi:outer membrane PBP1 activator LpoA protein